MPQKIFNTATRKKEVFQPIQEGAVGIYVCGITAYDVCHIGHARAAVVFDVVVRYLRAQGYNVTYVKNFTDIDDKIIDRANREGVSIADIAERYIKAHDEDMAALGVRTPTITPRATENMQEMIALIRTLEDKGYAYCVEGDVYFSISDYKQYGGLSGRNLEEMMAGARVDVSDKKKNPLDFALWKNSKEGEPFWESPWGKGRPGWHIECSAMSRRYLGETFDIHGGGEDLIFPHHENEIAQSAAATGKPLARYWMHNGFVKINSEKMSKSLGNIFPVKEILKHYHPEVLRLFMLQSHYRSPVDYSDDSLSEARAALFRCYRTLQQMKELQGQLAAGSKPVATQPSGRVDDYVNAFQMLKDKFNEAMDDDFNTAQALGYVFDMVRQMNNFMMKEKSMPVADKTAVLAAAIRVFGYFGSVLGVINSDADQFFVLYRETELRRRELNADEIEELIRQRQSAREAKDWARADDIRKKLAGMNVVLKDSADGTSWTIE
ncbi:MAG TPA: cysteine--tRNA ligase [Smithella sp.]|jgi:cysteinyl-tRNA synthetase|nr:cysteine--tRNA ligase [Deltaproteobacteria bacterium]HOE32616.1 cysteine--tRNA ligase [Smithella sp.]HOG09485.1 cysteine--tRNA ligase [Smithella sp.]HOS13410.1 cysteine--tRNA ligase [Smithella sp.]HPC08758.1 cysteine--tRNA ligase [Smithella sp.]